MDEFFYEKIISGIVNINEECKAQKTCSEQCPLFIVGRGCLLKNYPPGHLPISDTLKKNANIK